MNVRATIASISMLGIFGVFLFWLYSIGKISITSIAILIAGGVIFVGITHLLYRKLWSESE